MNFKKIIKSFNYKKLVIFTLANLLSFTSNCFAQDNKNNNENKETNKDFEEIKSFSETLFSKLYINGWFEQNVFINTNPTLENKFDFSQRAFYLVSRYLIFDNLQFYSMWETSSRKTNNYGFSDSHLHNGFKQLWVQYLVNDSLKFRVGEFLTPFGEWNENSPASTSFLSPDLPNVIYGEFFVKEKQVQEMFNHHSRGIELSGEKMFNNNKLSYKVYFSGQESSSDEEYEEQNDINQKGLNKNYGIFDDTCIGTRLSFTSFDTLKMGSSFRYSMKDINKKEMFIRNLAFDLSYRVNNFEMWSEVAWTNINEVDTNNNYFNGLGYYLWLAYYLEHGLTPYIRYNSFSPNAFNPSKEVEPSINLGLNYTINSQLVLKLDLNYNFWERISKTSHSMITSQLAVSF